MEPAILGIVLDSSIIIEAERKHQTVEELLESIQQRFGEIAITMSAVTLAELVHGVARANTPERRTRRRAFIDELKQDVPVPSRNRRDGRTGPERLVASRRQRASRFRSMIC
jgi:predicted nucleic acid-binding protein